MVVSGAVPRGPRNSQIAAPLSVFMDELPSIAPFQRRIDELAAQMAEPAFYSNSRRAAEVTREHQKLSQLIADHQQHATVERELAEAVAFGKDPASDRSCANWPRPNCRNYSGAPASCARRCCWR
jgi:protein subunit release factor A